MTYNVFSGTLNPRPTQSINQATVRGLRAIMSAMMYVQM